MTSQINRQYLKMPDVNTFLAILRGWTQR